MRRWLASWLAAAREVSDRPTLWLPGALAWTVGAGWIPLLVAVAPPPTEADLTFFGAGIFTSGAWPWNALLMATGAVAIVIAAVGLVSLAEASLVARLEGRAPRSADAGRIFGVTFVAIAPVLAVAVVTATAALIVAPGEFRGPSGDAGPVVATLVAIAPLLVALVVSAVLGTAIAAAATRLVAASRATSLRSALAAAPRELVAGGRAVLAQAVATWLVRIAYLAVSALLLGVLWAPIGGRLMADGARIDVGLGLLLVGFVAIWLCLVLGGGAVHAWASATWTRVLDRPPTT